MIYVCIYLSVLRGVIPQMSILDFTCHFTAEPLDITTSFRNAVLSTTSLKSISCQLSLQVTPLGSQKTNPSSSERRLDSHLTGLHHSWAWWRLPRTLGLAF